MSLVLRVTDASFERDVIASEVPVLLEFWGSWCPPCKMMEPLLTELAAECDGSLVVAKINADQHPRARSAQSVQGLPTFIVFVQGGARGRRVGAQSKAQLMALLDEANAEMEAR